MTQRPLSTHLSRRSLFRLGAGLIGLGALADRLASPAWAQAVDLAPTPSISPPTIGLTPDQALATLMDGNQRFVARKQLNPHQDIARITEVAVGQEPFAAILSCADSRVVPEIAFDQGMGDLFVVRVAGNVARIDEIASEEYAIALLKTPLLMVLGHERCGAVTAALNSVSTGGEWPGDIASLVLAIEPAVKASAGEEGDRLTNAVKANVRLQVDRLLGSSVIAAAVQEGQLKVVGAYYDLDTGVISLVG
jgi:carbonic anhydrase